MPIPTSQAPWWGSLIWLITLTAAAFGVAWLSGTHLHIRKGRYIPLLLVVTAGFTAGYVAWLGVGVGDVITARWAWGLLTGAIIALVLVLPASRQPVDRPVHGAKLPMALGWEGVVYGTGEGLLLSTLPPFMTWQMIHSLGWSGPPGAIARWTLPIVAGATVIVIHHLGYWSCRNRVLIPITLGLSVLTLGFLVTGSWLAPVVAHILLHDVLIVRGSEMPPHDRPTAATSGPALTSPRAA
jgi:hypothetical protein